ncbi:MAG: phosphate ABC transporter substrate-binding protein PstS [Deltaproteobacteria bacterium]|jgi:phosphate transport system substrate-binding protein|nr:phosphate ABC transporter substrate-binding protein PstS [Deltaproteobacteria bacterium]MBW2536660.1 phosphate ABC transporter substrate-binding protein PstS [Deltaproteobacteria bacterium]
MVIRFADAFSTRWAVALGCLLSCSCSEPRPAPHGGDTSPTSRYAAVTVRGAGATFPQPIYAKWSLQYLQEASVKVVYRAVGSEAGIAAMRQGTADFGVNEVPLGIGELADDGLCQFPVVIGAVVPVVHLPGVGSGELRLDADDLAGIYLGRITRWDDPAIADDNPGTALPARDIIPIHRAHASGTTWIFARYLEQHSALWRSGADVASPPARLVGVPAESNEQVARFVRQFKHTIGYVEYAYAAEHSLSCVALRVPGGGFVSPSRASFEKAAAHAELDANEALQVTFSSLDAVDTWPIMGVSYALVRQKQDRPSRSSALLSFFRWALTDGVEHAQRLDYVALPRHFLGPIDRRWTDCIRGAGAPAAPTSPSPPSHTTAPSGSAPSP